MSLRKKHLFLATLKGHSGPPPPPITLIPIFFEFLDPKIGGGVLGPNPTAADGSVEGGGASHLVPHTYIYVFQFIVALIPKLPRCSLSHSINLFVLLTSPHERIAGYLITQLLEELCHRASPYLELSF